jgi:hypothetical protein
MKAIMWIAGILAVLWLAMNVSRSSPPMPVCDDITDRYGNVLARHCE